MACRCLCHVGEGPILWRLRPKGQVTIDDETRLSPALLSAVWSSRRLVAPLSELRLGTLGVRCLRCVAALLHGATVARWVTLRSRIDSIDGRVPLRVCPAVDRVCLVHCRRTRLFLIESCHTGGAVRDTAAESGPACDLPCRLNSAGSDPPLPLSARSCGKRRGDLVDSAGDDRQ